MKKILQVVGCLELGGTEAFIMNHYRNIDRNEYQFDFLVLTEKNYPYIPEIKKLGGNVFFSGLPSIGNFQNFYKAFKKVVMENGPYDAVHSHINVANGNVLFVAKKLGIPIRISHSHDTSGLGGSLITRMYRGLQVLSIKRCATKFLACSNLAGDYLYGKDFFEKHGSVIHNGINVSAFNNIDENLKKALKKELSIPDNSGLVVGNITRFEEKKNSLFTIEVFNEILKTEPSAILIMGGPDGGLLDEVKSRIAELKIEDSVRLVGARSDIPVCLSIINAYLFPSKYEGLGIVMLEAQAAACECFASTGVSPECDMGIGNIHFYSLNKSAEYWAENILEVMSKRKHADEQRIKDCFVNKGYDITASVKTLTEVYDGK